MHTNCFINILKNNWNHVFWSVQNCVKQFVYNKHYPNLNMNLSHYFSLVLIFFFFFKDNYHQSFMIPSNIQHVQVVPIAYLWSYYKAKIFSIIYSGEGIWCFWEGIIRFLLHVSLKKNNRRHIHRHFYPKIN